MSKINIEATNLSLIPWNDDVDYIGVDYTDKLEKTIVDSQPAIEFAAAIQAGAQEFGPVIAHAI